MVRKDHIFFVLCLAFLCGVALASFWVVSGAYAAVIVCCGAALSYIVKRIVLFILAVVCVIGYAWFGLYNDLAVGELSAWNGRGEIEIQGVVAEMPQYGATSQHFVVDAESVRIQREEKEIEGKVRITAMAYPRYQQGDVIVASGELEEPPVFEEFSYQNYLFRYNVLSLMRYPQVREAPEERKATFIGTITKARLHFERKVNSLFPEPHASFLAGLLIGSRRGIPDDLMEAFNVTGTTHIIAISGYNIAILIALIGNIFSNYVSQRTKFLLCTVLIVLFVFFCGAPASVVRAAIMGLLVVWARNSGRLHNPTNVLLATCVVMTFMNPKVLIFDTGFQLSFLATCGILYFSPFLERFTKWLPQTMEIRESVMLTISAQICVLPILVASFGSLSVITVFANLVVLPIIPMIMASGFVATLAGYIYWGLGFVISFIPKLFLDFELAVITNLAKFSWASFPVPSVPPWMIAAYFLLLLFLWAYIRKRQDRACSFQKG